MQWVMHKVAIYEKQYNFAKAYMKIGMNMENNERITDYIHKLINADKTIKRGLVEEVSQGALIPYWIKNSGKKVIIYGGGRIDYIWWWKNIMAYFFVIEVS